MAAVWPHLEQVSDHGTPVLLEHASLAAGERVLDVGCGGGKQTLALAQAVGPEGSVVGIDISERMIALAQARAAQAGAANVALMVGDAQTEALPSNEFDCVVSQFGCMFFETPSAAYANLFTALKPGGRITCVVWQSAERMTWMPNRLLQPLMPDAESPINPHALADADYVASLFGDAGFRDVDTREVNIEADVAADFIQDAFTLDAVPAENKDRARQLIEDHKAQFRVGDRYHIGLPMLVIRASKASA
jgi:SAM-dependent methyltransferase